MEGSRRLLVTVYGLFAVAATARSIYQIATDWDSARLAYALSALAAVVYIVAAVAIARQADRLARAAVAFELVGLLAVGTASIVAADHFPEPTVWSDYGVGYGFVPLVLPIAGLAWFRWGGGRGSPAEDAA